MASSVQGSGLRANAGSKTSRKATVSPELTGSYEAEHIVLVFFYNPAFFLQCSGKYVTIPGRPKKWVGGKFQE